ncbi:hypothetical protein ACFRFQ_09310 [Rhodococcus sp. NPDC056743]|uniref:hypothetical protein n=1 Tax=Rhodococcus sp. NPDC056743 TaxID=3345934 RepID=UPI00366CFED9
MKFNLAVTAILALCCIVVVGRLAASVMNAHDAKFLLLLACIVSAAMVSIWRTVNHGQEPATFAAVTYLAFGSIVVVAEALAGDPTRAVITAIALPILPVYVVSDPRMRRWVNERARYPSSREGS